MKSTGFVGLFPNSEGVKHVSNELKTRSSPSDLENTLSFLDGRINSTAIDFSDNSLY
jgi:hypothetical protein